LGEDLALTDIKKTILYIEDDPASRRLVERTLLFAGYNVLVAERGIEGVDLARKHQPDLILTDINLPDLSGQEISSTLRREERFAHTPIVALTAQSHGGADWEMAFAAGINGYITKPLDVEALIDQVDYYLKGGQDHIDSERLASAQLKYTQSLVSRLEGRIRDLERVNTELIQLDKMKDTFIQLTAHELRTPLTLVFGYTRLLEDNPTVRSMLSYDEDMQILVEGLNEAVERLQALIDEIVTISRIMTNRIDISISVVNVGTTAAKAVKHYAKAMQERDLTLHFNPADFPSDLRGDAELLYIVFLNLISNAIKYTPDGGTITLSAHHDDHQLRFTVSDTGIGIDRAIQRDIFERFYTATDVMLHSTSKTAFGGGGLGLGLPICRGIIEAHGGQIWVESEGKDPKRCPGSTFVVTLPMAATRVKKVQV
jgi:signal transduction histidine kinase